MTLDYQALCFIPLALAVICGLYRWQGAALFWLWLTAMSALVVGVMSPMALIYALLGLALAMLLPRLKGKLLHLGWLLLLLWLVPLLLHQAPGFNNPLVLQAVHSGPLSSSFSMYLNFDRALIFFALLMAWPQLSGPGGPVKPRLLLATIPALGGIILLAWLLGAVKPEWSLPQWVWLFALNNLLITCVTEEALFRGLLQQWFSRLFGNAAGLIIAAVLFGVAHLAGGGVMVVLATLAGLVYGLAFYASGRLWVAIVLHFAFNLIHLLFFTYPMLAR
ncbi:CAAX amino protease [Shewanella sp. NFH-SH190041]|uniref:CPBP family intramembrane glutamic endopeptidase n=1 Tax=Shewanella sp. NFH-SH190041 TaxID=2950245 RepID=UPI0021C26194|nr:CPBP family intramembrane glutamic endopeptidase [Shewanella sp. NFH-SH190041]BDM63562.1 CAAX amino protease [Shewanella sp. NFH-SH190041]